MSYASNGKLSKAIVDNRKFFAANALVYEQEPPSALLVTEENNMQERQNYSYGNPLQDNMYSYRYDSFVAGHRDMDRLDKPYTEIPLPAPKKMSVAQVEAGQLSKPIKENYEHSDGICNIDEDGVISVCGGGKENLYSIMDPRFNLREAAKNMILLEDHLSHRGKSCQDCILKHCLMIEGFLEEGITLDKKREYTVHFDLSNDAFRLIFKHLSGLIQRGELTNEECCKIAQDIRKIRKPLCQQFATFF